MRIQKPVSLPGWVCYLGEVHSDDEPLTAETHLPRSPEQGGMMRFGYVEFSSEEVADLFEVVRRD